jgi:hypothetical protein
VCDVGHFFANVHKKAPRENITTSSRSRCDMASWLSGAIENQRDRFDHSERPMQKEAQVAQHRT